MHDNLQSWKSDNPEIVSAISSTVERYLADPSQIQEDILDTEVYIRDSLDFSEVAFNEPAKFEYSLGKDTDSSLTIWYDFTFSSLDDDILWGKDSYLPEDILGVDSPKTQEGITDFICNLVWKLSEENFTIDVSYQTDVNGETWVKFGNGDWQ